MSSPDDTFFNIKRLHVVFAVSSLALLAVTIWMLAAAHLRQWKVYQRTYRDSVEPWLTEARLHAQKSEEYAARENELVQAVAEAGKRVPGRALIDAFVKQLNADAARRKADPPDAAKVRATYDALVAQPSVKNRRTLLASLERFAAAAKLRQAGAERKLRFRRADFDEARSTYEAAVGEGRPQQKLDKLQQRTDRIKKDIDLLTTGFERTSSHLAALTGLLSQITEPEDTAQKALADHRATEKQLRRNLRQQRPNLAKRLLRLPLIDAFGRPLAISQIWLPELTINYNFRQVARFDRCVTCHQSIGKTKPGAPFDPACLAQRILTVRLPIGVDEEDDDEDENGDEKEKSRQTEPSLQTVLGLSLAARGILDPGAPTVGLVLPKTPAARAKLQVGDVILKINGQPAAGRAEAEKRLLEAALEDPARSDDDQSDDEDDEEEDDNEESSRSIELEIRRGLPHPYSSHPRLDLFVGSLSPHPMAQFGCTVCHDGQGSATEFKWASHTPNDPHERTRWHEQYGWFHNEHWDFPMLPARFAESRCLKCHHDVTDLEPSRRFPRAPAPKLLAGYQLIRENGCFGCHEIKGVDQSGRRIGPDMRLEPNYTGAALRLAADPALNETQKALARQVITQPEKPGPRHELVESLRADLPRSERLEVMVGLLSADEPTPGTMRKLGPTLRGVAAKLDARFMESWIRDPTDFRPDTRMPRFFVLHEHLDGQSLKDARRFEAVEVRALSEYILGASPPFERIEPEHHKHISAEPASVERGKRLFGTHGCLACHKHPDFPEGQSTQGPNLANFGSKFTDKSKRLWPVYWLRDPAAYSPRTLMPDALFEPVPLVETAKSAEKPADSKQAGGKPKKRRVTASPLDITAYLLSSKGWKPKQQPPKPAESDLDKLALLHLCAAFPREQAEQYLKNGIPKSMAERVQGDAVELLGKITRQKKLRYVGRRTVRKRGCYGCHDIPGFEDAQPIGPALSDWGRKEESLLAFEQVHQFIAKAEGKGEGKGGKEGKGREGGKKKGEKVVDDPARGFFMEALLAHRREGFIWQKLRDPRSFDYKKAQNKGYNERLLMGRFNFSDDQIEAIATFVLGLVAEPPADRYVYQPGPRAKAIVEGRKVLEKYACAECHTLEMERWRFEYDPEMFEDPPEIEDYPLLTPHFTPEQLAASELTDSRGLGHAEVVGMPRVDVEGELIEDEDDDGNPLYFFTLWEPAAINGQVWRVAGAEVMISEPQITAKRPPLGGAFARLLYPMVLAEAKASGSSASEMEAWGWVPPPLVHEGLLVQPAWLHDYLLDPLTIRPAAVLKMPKYTLSSDEAGKLVDYFAAAAGVEFPYSRAVGNRAAGLQAKERKRPHRLDDAMRLVTDQKTYCAKCHLIGDFSPGGEIRTILAPNLDQVGRRLRPEYIRRWLANPKVVLPYTGMPVNFPPTGDPLGQDLFKGSSVEQLDAVVDLLLNYDHYMNSRTPVLKMVEGLDRSKPAAPKPKEPKKE